MTHTEVSCHYDIFGFSCPSSLMNMLVPLFELDPLFRRTYLLCVPPVAFGKIAASGRFPPVEICTTLCRVFFEKAYIMLDEVRLS